MGKNINSTNSLFSFSFSFSRIQRCIDLAFLDTVQQNMIEMDKFLSLYSMYTGWKKFTCYTLCDTIRCYYLPGNLLFT
ncbi:unnamed protein product [Musa textilis]